MWSLAFYLFSVSSLSRHHSLCHRSEIVRPNSSSAFSPFISYATQSLNERPSCLSTAFCCASRRSLQFLALFSDPYKRLVPELQVCIECYCDSATLASLALAHPSWTATSRRAILRDVRIDDWKIRGSSSLFGASLVERLPDLGLIRVLHVDIFRAGHVTSGYANPIHHLLPFMHGLRYVLLCHTDPRFTSIIARMVHHGVVRLRGVLADADILLSHDGVYQFTLSLCSHAQQGFLRVLALRVRRSSDVADVREHVLRMSPLVSIFVISADGELAILPELYSSSPSRLSQYIRQFATSVGNRFFAPHGLLSLGFYVSVSNLSLSVPCVRELCVFGALNDLCTVSFYLTSKAPAFPLVASDRSWYFIRRAVSPVSHRLVALNFYGPRCLYDRHLDLFSSVRSFCPNIVAVQFPQCSYFIRDPAVNVSFP